MTLDDVQSAIVEECDAVKEVLLTKNRQYGNSALSPMRVFSTASNVEQIHVRIDDKLSRLANARQKGTEMTIAEDTVLDLIGYLMLLRIANRSVV